MERKRSPIQFRKSGVSGEGNGTPKLNAPQGASTLTSTPATLHPPALFGPVATPSSLSASPRMSAVHSSADELYHVEDSTEADAAVSSGSLPSLGSNEALHCVGGDEVDGGSSHAPDLQRTKAAIEHIQQKIIHTKELIKAEQTTRDENVNEYLKLATNADKQQLQRIKSVFEKKNQRSAQTIAQLQKKLENYNKRIRDLETHGLPRGMLRQGLKDVRANIKGGISGLSGGVVGNLKGGLSGLSAATHTAAETVMSKPREFAHLIKNRFGSADNINAMAKSEECRDEAERHIHHGSATSTHSTKYTSDDENSSITSESGQLNMVSCAQTSSPQHHPVLQSVPSGTESATIQSSSGPTTYDLEPILHELRSQREEYQHLVEEIEAVKNQIQQESSFFNQALQEERYRYERLEEQMNDLIELHQNEIENLKQGIADMEEKVQYQSEERLRDVHDVLDSCQTRISRMEHQQHQHLQQLVSLDSLENSQARALLLKLINVALTVLQVVLLLVATLANIIMPFLRTRVRTLTTISVALVIVAICHQWPELLDWFRTQVSPYLPSLPK